MYVHASCFFPYPMANNDLGDRFSHYSIHFFNNVCRLIHRCFSTIHPPPLQRLKGFSSVVKPHAPASLDSHKSRFRILLFISMRKAARFEVTDPLVPIQEREEAMETMGWCVSSIVAHRPWRQAGRSSSARLLSWSMHFTVKSLFTVKLLW